MLNGELSLHDAAGRRVVFHRLLGYFDDPKGRIARVKLALLPGAYRVRASEYGGKEAEIEIEVPAAVPAEPFVLDLR